MSITPKNWNEFQHYKNRCPPWIKLHRGLLDNFEFQRLPVASRALAPMLWLLASEYEGGKITLSIEALAFRVRMSQEEFVVALNPLIESGFFQSDSAMLAPCKQDACLETETETEGEREEEAEKRDRASLRSDGAGAPRDIRADLFSKGLKSLASITGKTPDSCRSLVGKWLKSVNDEAIHVLGAIEDAERNRVADPVAWINKTLQPRTNHANGRRSVQDAAADLHERVLAFEQPAPSGLRDGTSKADVRLLPAR